MPAKEFNEWQLFYALEPFGFEDREYRTAALLTMLQNVNVDKKSKQKKIDDYIRDMPKEIIKEMGRIRQEEKEQQAFENMTLEERKRFIASRFGAIVKKDVQIGNSSDHRGPTDS